MTTYMCFCAFCNGMFEGKQLDTICDVCNDRAAEIRTILTGHFGGGEWRGKYKAKFTPASLEIMALFCAREDRTSAEAACNLSSELAEPSPDTAANKSGNSDKCEICGAGKYDSISICDGICVHCAANLQGTPKPEGIAVRGQCAECPYKLTGVMALTGCPNCPNRDAA